MAQDPSPHEKPANHVRFNWVLTGFILIALFFLLTEHRAHLFGLLPWLLLLACPLMHLFGHGHRGGLGHGSHAHRGGPDGTEDRKEDPP